MKIAIAGKGGTGKTALAVALAEELASRGLRTLVVDCDPNPTLAESFGLDSGALHRFGHDRLRRAGGTLELAGEPDLIEVGPGFMLLAGPPGETPLNDAVARGTAGVLLADRFDAVVTDLGAGPEYTRLAVGGVLNPADLCVVLTSGTVAGDLTADRIERACASRAVPVHRLPVDPADAGRNAGALAERLLAGR